MINGSKKQCINRLVRGAHPEIQSLLRTAHEQGYRISKRGNGHFMVVPPPDSDCAELAFIPFTPSVYRVIANSRRKLRHLGVQFT